MTQKERILNKSIPEPNTGCWLWTESLDSGGYGRIRINGVLVSSHRAAYRIFVGEVPSGMELDHLCRVRSCCNPDHLEAVTPKENVARGDLWKVNGLKTHCPRGHEYSKNNTYSYKRKRNCRKCNNIVQKASAILAKVSA